MENTETRKEYWPNGQLMYEFKVLNGLPIGIVQYFYDNGNIQESLSFVRVQRSNLVNGIRQLFRKDGARINIHQRKEGPEQGVSIFFNYNNPNWKHRKSIK